METCWNCKTEPARFRVRIWWFDPTPDPWKKPSKRTELCPGCLAEARRKETGKVEAVNLLPAKF